MSALDRITKARTGLVMAHPFYGTLALRLAVVEDCGQNTMATDGQVILFNPDFVSQLTDAELRGVVAHEVMHCANLHHVRFGARDHDLWNQATDYAINADLISAGFALPAGALLRPEFNGLSAESIYEALRQEQAQQQQQQQQGGQGAQGGPQGAQGPGQASQGQDPGAGDPGGCGGVLPAAPPGDAQGLAQAEAEWQGAVRQAVAVARARNAGETPGDLERTVESLNSPALDWRELLRRFISESQRKDYSWTRPNRRHVASGLYLPGLVSDGLDELVVIVDTSGSFDEDCLAQACAELQAAFDDSGADHLTVIYCDYEVQRVDRFSQGDLIEYRPRGGGGTAFAPALDHVAEHIPQASAVCYLTDLECSPGDFGDDPGAPVIWIYLGYPPRFDELAARAPFGEVIQVTA